MFDLIIPVDQVHFLYHFFLTIGILSPFLFAWYMGKREGFPVSTWLTALTVVVGLMIIGARLGAFQIEEWNALFQRGAWHRETPKTVIGSIILGLLGFQILKKVFQMPAKTADIFVLGLPIGGVIGRIGCLMAGCCYGVPSDSFLGIRFGVGSSAYSAQQAAGLIPSNALASLPLHPAQWYLILGNALIFILCFRLRKRFRPGHLAYFVLILMACNRFGSEIFRDVATNRGMTGQVFLGLKAVQWLSVLFALGSALFWWRSRRSAAPLSFEFKAQPVHKLACIMLPLTAVLWIFRGRLGILETLTFILVCAPALCSILFDLAKLEIEAWKQVPSIVVFSGMFLLQIQLQVDSISQYTNPSFDYEPIADEWWSIGMGYGFSRYHDYEKTTTGSGCDSRTTVHRDREVLANMYGFEASKHYLNGNQHFAFGGRLGVGNGTVVNPEESGRFAVGALNGALDFRKMGFRLGITNLSDGAVRVLGHDHGASSNLALSGGIRIGNRERFSFDFQYKERHQFLYYPMPKWSIGFLNYGFNDPYGQKWLRGGLAYLGRDAGVSLFAAGSTLIDKNRMSIEYGVYMGEPKKYAVSMGLKYMLR